MTRVLLVLILLTGCAARDYHAYPPKLCWAMGGDVSLTTEYRSMSGWWGCRASCSTPRVRR